MFATWKLNVRAALDDVTQTSMPKWMVQRHLSRSDKKSTSNRTSYDVYKIDVYTYIYISCMMCVYYQTIIFHLYSILVLYLWMLYTCLVYILYSSWRSPWYNDIMGYNMTQLGPDRSSDGLPLIKQPRGCPAGRPGAGCFWEPSTVQIFSKGGFWDDSFSHFFSLLGL